VHGTQAAALARTLRARGLRAVVCDAPPNAAWLRGAGFDAAVLLDASELVMADGSQRPVANIEAIFGLLQGGSACPS